MCESFIGGWQVWPFSDQHKRGPWLPSEDFWSKCETVEVSTVWTAPGHSPFPQSDSLPAEKSTEQDGDYHPGKWRYKPPPGGQVKTFTQPPTQGCKPNEWIKILRMLSSLLLPLLILPSVTSWDTTIARGSTSCAHDALCKIAPGHTDGFTCTRSSTLVPNPCDILQTLYDRWGSEAKVLSHLLKEVGKILEAAQVTQNVTSQLLAGL